MKLTYEDKFKSLNSENKDLAIRNFQICML